MASHAPIILLPHRKVNNVGGLVIRARCRQGRSFRAEQRAPWSGGMRSRSWRSGLARGETSGPGRAVGSVRPPRAGARPRSGRGLRGMATSELADALWERRRPLLPPQKPRSDRLAKDHRANVSSILWAQRTVSPWRCLARLSGTWKAVSSRLSRWRLNICRPSTPFVSRYEVVEGVRLLRGPGRDRLASAGVALVGVGLLVELVRGSWAGPCPAIAPDCSGRAAGGPSLLDADGSDRCQP